MAVLIVPPPKARSWGSKQSVAPVLQLVGGGDVFEYADVQVISPIDTISQRHLVLSAVTVQVTDSYVLT